MLVTTATELPRLMVCIGSRNMPAALPVDHDKDARDEGNAAHWLAKYIFDNGDGEVGSGMKAPNGYTITDDMIEHVRGYVSALDCGGMEIECTSHGETWEVRSRADHIKYNGQVLTIDDFKYGWRLVEVERNWTLIAYAIGWCIINATIPREIVLRIHQPRPYHPEGTLREWRITYDELMGFYHQINDRLSNPTDDLMTSPQCAKCHALADCPAARRASMNAIDAAELAFSDTLSDAVLAHERETLRYALATIENRADALEELMTHRIKSGRVIEGYALKTRYANTKWKTGLTGKALSAMTGKDLMKDGIVTPAEAKRRGVPETVITSLTDRPIIGTKLERIDANAEAAKIFGKEPTNGK